MATKKVLVEINVEQKGAVLDKTTKDVKKLTDVEKERLRIKNETKKTDAKIEVANEKATKNLEKRKKDLKDVNDLSKTWTGIMKESVSQIGKTNDGLKKLNADYALWEKQSAAAAEQQEKLNKELESEQIKLFQSQVKKLTKEETLLEKQTKKLAFAQSDEAKELAILNEQTKRANKQVSDYAKKQVDAANATENTNDKMQEFKTTSGLTGAIVTEFGRTASDSAYGIRGMGNNISQLVTLFGQLSTNVRNAGGTMKDSFNQIFQSMKGVIGLMTAIQVVLGVIQAEWFQKWVSGLFKAKNGLEGFNSELRTTNLIANKYVDSLEKMNEKDEDRVAVTKELIRLVPTLKEEDLAYGKNLEKVRQEIAKYSLAQASRLEIDKLVEENSESLAKKQKIEGIKSIDDAEERSKRIQEFLANEVSWYEDNYEATVNVLGLQRKAVSEGRDKNFYTPQFEGVDVGIATRMRKTNEMFLSDLNKFESELDKEVGPILKKIQELTGSLTGSAFNEDDPIRRGFRSRLLDLKTLAEKFRQDSLKGEVKTDEELIKQKAEFSKKDLEIKLNNYIETERLRLKEFLETKGLSKKQKDVARKASEESIDRAKEDSKIVLENIEAVYDAEINLLRRKEGEKARIEQEALEEQERRKIIDRAGDTVVGYDSAFHQAQDARLQAELDIIQRRINAAEEGSLEMSNIEEEYYQASNQRIAFNTEQEKLSLEERTRMNQEYISYLNGASSVLAAIGNKNKEFQKAQLLAEKISAIASVSVQAARSVGTQIADSKASSLSNIRNWQFAGGSLNPVATASYIATEAKIKKDRASGIANTKIGAGLSIAAITAGAISGLSDISNSGSSSSSSSSGSVQPPDFNIVGSTGVNQLADAIGSTETPIVKAVVVASEVTTQQALDRNNRSNAEL